MATASWASRPTRGSIKANKVGIVVAGNSSRVAAMAGVRMPIESHVLQAMVTEPIKPVLDTVVTSGAAHCTSARRTRARCSWAAIWTGTTPTRSVATCRLVEHVVASALTMFPCLSRLRLMRTWGGIMDMTMDGSPIIAKLPVKGLYFDGGWCYGGFKATPGSGWVFAHTIAQDRPHPQNEAFTLERFHSGHLLDEKGAGACPGAH